MRRDEAARIITAARRLGDKLEGLEKALDCYLEDFFAPLQEIYDVIESSTGTRWEDNTWEAVFDSKKDVSEVLSAIEKDVLKDREESGNKETKIFD